MNTTKFTNLPILQRSSTPLSLPKHKAKKLTPVLLLKPDRNFVNLPSGKFTRFITVSLKNIFNSLCEYEEEAANSSRKTAKVQLNIFAEAAKKIPELCRFSELFEDLKIFHNKSSFSEILEIICSDASAEQMNLINSWLSDWQNKQKKAPNFLFSKAPSKTQIKPSRTATSLTPKKF